LKEAESLERESLALRLKVLGPLHPDVAKSLYLVGDRLREEGDLAGAILYLNKALAMQHKLLGEDNPTALDTLHSLGMTLEDQGKLKDAEKIDREALDLWRRRGEAEIPQAASQLKSLISDLKAEKKFGEAQETLNEALTPAFAKQAASSDLLALRADFEARLGQWQKAADDLDLAFEWQPGNPRYALVAALLVRTHNFPAYESLCRRLLAAFATTSDIYAADQVAKSCLLLSSSKVDLKVVERLVDTTVARGTNDSGAMPYFEECKALCEYRLGNYAEAVEWAQKPLKIPSIDVHSHSYAVLAMADWMLGKQAEARIMLDNGNLLAPTIMPRIIAQDPGNKWEAWLYARIQLEEATALIRP
jgi:tetratricopeptide (TPR) repeat protein